MASLREECMDNMNYHKQQRAFNMKQNDTLKAVQAVSWCTFVWCIVSQIHENRFRAIMPRNRWLVMTSSSLIGAGSFILDKYNQYEQQGAYHEGQFFVNQTIGGFDWNDNRIEEY